MRSPSAQQTDSLLSYQPSYSGKTLQEDRKDEIYQKVCICMYCLYAPIVKLRETVQ